MTIRDSIARAVKGEFVRWDTPLYASPDGSVTIIINASVMPVKDDQVEVVFLACEGRDITEKKAQDARSPGRILSCRGCSSASPRRRGQRVYDSASRGRRPARGPGSRAC